MKEFKQVRENLLDMLEDIDNGLGKITDNSNPSDINIANDLDQPTVDIDCNNSETASKDKISSEIDTLKQAISQIDSSTYGICLSCGQPIRKQDLTAAPLSNHCIHCTETKNGN